MARKQKDEGVRDAKKWYIGLFHSNSGEKIIFGSKKLFAEAFYSNSGEKFRFCTEMGDNKVYQFCDYFCDYLQGVQFAIAIFSQRDSAISCDAIIVRCMRCDFFHLRLIAIPE